MGQYWKLVNLDKMECVNPHMLGVGLKLGEQIGSGHGTPDALFILVAAMRERRGGGDFDWDSNYHGVDRYTSEAKNANLHGGKVNEDYDTIAKRTIGRWAGDRVAVVGDYTEDSDLPGSPIPASEIYVECEDEYTKEAKEPKKFKDITADVAKVIEHEIGGKFVGSGWKQFKPLR